MSRVLYDFTTTHILGDGRLIGIDCSGQFYQFHGSIAARLPDADHDEPYITYSGHGRCGRPVRQLVLAHLERERLLHG